MLRVTHIAVQVAGQPGLRLLAEVGVLDSLQDVEVTRVTGDRVTRTDVARALRQPTDLVVWSGHGVPGRLLLADGVVTAAWIATQIRAGAPRLVVIASCGSDVADDRLRSITTAISRRGINVVGFPVITEDVAAGVYVVELVRALVAGADVASAHEVAIEEVGGEDQAAARGIELRAGLLNGYRDLLDRMNGYDARLGRVEISVSALVEHFGVNVIDRRG